MSDDDASIVDISGAQARGAGLGAVWRLALIAAAAGLAYAAATADQADRGAIATLFAGLAGLGGVAALLPRSQLARSRWLELILVLWSAASVAVIAMAVAIDGGPTSPLALLFFLPVVTAALAFPLRAAVAVGVVAQVALLATGLTSDAAANPAAPGFFSLCLACVAVVGALQARDHERHRRELVEASRTDPLTGLLNRRGLHERLEAELSAGKRMGRPFSLAILDLDGFKVVNDRDGDAAGDELLQRVAVALTGAVRGTDVVGRLGGDEFVVLLPGTVKIDARELGERLRATVAADTPSSVGIAAHPEDGVDAESLLAGAGNELSARKPIPPAPTVARRLELARAAAFAHAVDERMAPGSEHGATVAGHAASIAAELGWGEDAIGELRVAAMLHDVGKVTIPDRILRKTGPLDPEEFVAMADHPVAGWKMLRQITGLERVAEWVLRSHEHIDGSGYPDGLAGDEIPHASRILLVADAFDAMTSRRPYREAVSQDAALAELRRWSGRQFDPRCVEALETALGAARST